MNDMEDKSLSANIRATERTLEPVEGKLETDEQVLVRITEGIYRQPASALRELVSNAYDADATEVVIMTDAPRFEQITVRDNGRGLTPEVVTQLVKHIGGSAKRSEKGKELGVTAATNANRSEGGRQLIGKLGIGLFSVAQFTRHFLIITKTSGDDFRTVADITLGKSDDQQAILPLEGEKERRYETGQYRIWREPTTEKLSHGTEIKLLDLLPRTRDELASADVWTRQDYLQDDPTAEKTDPPQLHIGRMDKKSDLLAIQPALPWAESDGPKLRFEKLVKEIRSLTSQRESVDLRKVCDNYLWSLWTLALSAPVEYVEGHPFDLKCNRIIPCFEIENQMRGQARPIELPNDGSLRKTLNLKSPDGPTAGRFEVFMDGVQLFRPILFQDLPLTENVVRTPLIFVGRQREEFEGKPIELSGGPLEFEAYLFWAPRIVPKQHQGVILRVGNASGALFDAEFMGYETSELTRKSQVTAEIFVSEGLDDAINLDRESFNFAHPHYQFLTKWLHSAFRQFSNRQKGLAKELRDTQRQHQAEETQEKVQLMVHTALKSRGIEDIPAVELLEHDRASEFTQLRKDGFVVLRRESVVPASAQSRQTSVEINRLKLAEKKAVGIAQLLHGMGLMDSLSYIEQEKLIRDILEIVLLDS